MQSYLRGIILSPILRETCFEVGALLPIELILPCGPISNEIYIKLFIVLRYSSIIHHITRLK